ncbi:MAG TPA: oligosaccharide flippase family protein [Allosphingosinicella sp.]|nr:oligosaccharide flippase family protein [Allosphingosinicella sp.]
MDPLSGAPAALGERVKGAVMWRSGSQVVAQLVTWGSTFLVIRLLDPSDYGLFAMTQVVLVLLNLMNGWGFASALVQRERIDREQIRQVFGLLILLNTALAAIQFAMAPIAAAYFRHPEVADLLRVQAVLYFSTPLIALPSALLGREIDFRRQALVNLVSAMLGAGTALACAYAGWGVWTLVAAPLVLWWSRAIGMTIAARTLVKPSFRFKGAGPLLRYGSAMVAVQFFWFFQSQADVFIGARVLGAHELGVYTTALFLTQILAAKFVPPLNDVAFAAYSRMQDRRDAMGGAFLKSVRLIMLIALPFYFGLAVTAEPLVLTALGGKWAEAVPIVPILAMAMPFMTLQILFAPATNALGRPGVALRAGATGAVILPGAFLIGLSWGIAGLSWAWLGGMALLCAATAAMSLPAIGVTGRALAASLAPGLLASAAMAGLVAALDALLPPLGPPARLLALVAFGAGVYVALLFALARPLVEEALALVRAAPRGEAAPAG